MSKERVNRKILILFFAIFIVAQAMGQSTSSWLALSPVSEASWQITAERENGRVLVLEPITMGDDPKKILVLFPKASSAYDTAMDTILGFFLDKRKAVHFTLINFEGRPDRGLQALAWAEKTNQDLIFSMGSQSTQFIHEHYSGGKLPVVTVCSKDPVLLGQVTDYDAGSGTNIAYTSLDASLSLQLNYLKRLKKNLKNLALLYAEDNISAVKTQVKPMAALARSEGINVIHIAVEKQGNARQELSRKIPAALEVMRHTDPELLQSIFWITGSTSVFQEIETIDTLSEGVPVLSVVPDLVREGEQSAVLSIGVSFDNNALKAALYALAILEDRADPGALEVGVVSPPDIAINFGKAQQIGLTIPFSFFESAGTIYDYEGRPVREKGRRTSAR